MMCGGFAFCFGANVFRSMKVTLQQKLLTGEAKEKFDPTTLLFWVSFPSVTAMMCGSVVSEGAKPYVTKHLGAVGGQLVSQAKMVLTVLGGMVLFGEKFSQLETFGFALALVGVYTFTRMDQAFKAKQKAMQDSLKVDDK